MISLILIFLAAFFNAVMDKTKDTIQYNSSQFRGLNPYFWDDSMWMGKFVPFTRYKFNAWHVSKSLMLFCLLAVPFFYKPILGKLDYLLFGIEWILVFNLFYNLNTVSPTNNYPPVKK